jgi:TRAP-type C4-dicarboxylate transport system permease small subunit
MRILRKIWDHLEEIFLIPSLMFSTALIFIQVIMRYVFHHSLSWSEELVRYLYVWETWIGVSYAARNGTHLRITMVKDRLPAAGQKVLELFVTAVWIGFAVFVFIQSAAAVKTIMSFGQVSSALKIPMQFCYASIPVGMVLMIIRVIERTVKDLFLKPTSSEGGAAE